MLSDTTIKRDKNYNYARRMILYLRKKASKKNRPLLNKEIQKKLTDISFTIFSNNCLGGVFYHDAGKKFTSPLINTAMDGEDFLKFLENPKYYLNCEMKFIEFPGHPYPIAQIDDIEVRFVHYKSKEEAREKWIERSKRIIWDNIFVIATNHDGLGSEDCLERFDKLPYKKIMYVSQVYPKYEWAVCVPQFKGRFQVRIMTNFANFHGERYYETAFNLADWIVRESKKYEEG